MDRQLAPADADPSFPRLHTRPARHWLNDPNGLCHHDGRWHVFAQHNPRDTVAGDICWWHADSTDLLHWRDRGVALRPSRDERRADRDGVWSGNAVSHGGILHAFYCGFRSDAPLQPAMTATSVDGVDFTAPGDVLADLPDRLLLPDGTPVQAHTMRDPFVWYDSAPGQADRWSMVLGAGLETTDGERYAAVLRYLSTDLHTWTPAGVFHHLPVPADALDADGRSHGTGTTVDTGEMWECPAWARLPGDRGMSMLMVCPWYRDSFPARVVALVGRRNGDRFHQDNAEDLDDGDALYAPSLLPATDGRLLLWGWARELRPMPEAQAAGWAGSLTFPREITERDGRVRVAPAAELTGLRARPCQPGHAVRAVEVELSGRAGDNRVGVQAVSGDARLDISADPAHGYATVGEHRLRLTDDDRWWLRVLVDGSVVEAFASSGRCATTRIYPGDSAGWTLARAAESPVQAWELSL